MHIRVKKTTNMIVWSYGERDKKAEVKNKIDIDCMIVYERNKKACSWGSLGGKNEMCLTFWSLDITFTARSITVSCIWCQDIVNKKLFLPSVCSPSLSNKKRDNEKKPVPAVLDPSFPLFPLFPPFPPFPPWLPSPFFPP